MIRKLQNEKEDRSEISAYISNVRHLKNNFVTCKLKHALRQANRVAHTLAKEGFKEANTYLGNGLSRSVVMEVEEDRRGSSDHK